MKKIAGFLMVIVFVSSCKQKPNHAGIEQFCKNQLPQWNKKLTYVIMTDIFSPPVSLEEFIVLLQPSLLASAVEVAPRRHGAERQAAIR